MTGPWGVEPGSRAQGRINRGKPVAVLDIGSNSVRLVVYERHARALTPLYNEKAACALGQGVAATGKLAEKNAERAFKAMRRYALVARLMGVGHVYVLATSAVRDAVNGPDFAAEVAEIMQTDVQTLTGAEEAHYAALGVVAGMPDFAGVVGDLGGGSLELSQVEQGKDSEGETHGLGVIRVQEDAEGSPSRAARIARERLQKSVLLEGTAGRTFCAIGGTWRALVKLHQRQRKYPLHMVQEYTVKAADIVKLCETVIESWESVGNYSGSEFVSSSRRNLLPFGCAVLAETLKAGRFSKVVFSALGVREGYLFGHLPARERNVDPLLQGSEEMSVLRARSPDHAHDLIGFTSAFVSGVGLVETEAERRLRLALCFLSDIGWRGHPDYRGEQSVDLVAYGALVGIDHPGRAFLSEALAVRYMGLKHKSVSMALLKLAGSKGNARARTLGALLRVAYPLSAGMAGVLPRAGFVREGERLILTLPADFAFLDGDRLSNRLSQLADTAGFGSSEVRIV